MEENEREGCFAKALVEHVGMKNLKSLVWRAWIPSVNQGAFILSSLLQSSDEEVVQSQSLTEKHNFHIGVGGNQQRNKNITWTLSACWTQFRTWNNFVLWSVFPMWKRGPGVHFIGNLWTLYMCFFLVYKFVYKMLYKNNLQS